MTKEGCENKSASLTKEFYWIGLNDLETEGRWVWVNNQTLNETGVQFWYKRESEQSEPDNWKEEDPSGENCACVDLKISHIWYDVSCKRNIKFICEKKNKHTFPFLDDKEL
ncbi:putative C-type lectin domain family 4 member F-like [Triplophysa rosa]|uniref:C-type lectin domain family 4 member F-like n=1 Tax=Triplophysa rosa TaxID=992332 RepID=A0A9W8C5V9_TRIRA|nr:putative C-type lectin domain family 4 member F-like [Triplophysa rosa]